VLSVSVIELLEKTLAFLHTTSIWVYFQGTHAYISPSWYTTIPLAKAVPTWNYTQVEVVCKNARVFSSNSITDTDNTNQIVQRLVSRYETTVPDSTYNSTDLAPGYLEQELEGIVGFELQIHKMEAKFKLSQNRSKEDQKSVVKGLKTYGDYNGVKVAQQMESRL